MTAAVEHFASEFANGEASLPGHGTKWLDSYRRAGLARLEQSDLPTIRDEDWKYTNVASIAKREFASPGETCIGLDEDDIARFLCPDLTCHRLTFVNGRFTPQLSRLRDLPNGVTVRSLAAVLDNEPDRVRSEFTDDAEHANGFAALNAALIADGGYIQIAQNVTVEQPIHLLFLTTGQEQLGLHLRNQIDLHENARAVVLEHYGSLADGAHLTNTRTHIALAQGASCDHYKIQEESKKAFHIGALRAVQHAGSRLVSHAVSLGAMLARHDLDSDLVGSGAHCTMNGLYVTRTRQHVDFHTRVDHRAPGCSSDEYYKGVLDDHSRAVFNGRVYVHQDAQQTDAQQANHNLLLSRNAEIDTKPQLEIYADDVKCAHGATVGQLDANQLFYLRARGLPEDVARGLLIYGFARDVVQRMDLEPVRERLESEFQELLPESSALKSGR